MSCCYLICASIRAAPLCTYMLILSSFFKFNSVSNIYNPLFQQEETKVSSKSTSDKQQQATSVKEKTQDKKKKSGKGKKNTSSKEEQPKKVRLGFVKAQQPFANYKLVEGKEPEMVACHYAVSVDLENKLVLTSEKKDGVAISYGLDHCAIVSKKFYQQWKAENKKSAKAVSTEKRLCPRDYTIVLAWKACEIDNSLEYLFKQAQEHNVTEKSLTEIRQIIKDKLPNLKLGQTQAVQEFNNLLNSKKGGEN